MLGECNVIVESYTSKLEIKDDSEITIRVLKYQWDSIQKRITVIDYSKTAQKEKYE